MSRSYIKVSEVMKTDIHFIDGVESVRTAISRMQELNVTSLVIEKRHEGDEFGIITTENIAAQVIACNRSTNRNSVYEAMTKPAITLDGDMNIKYAIRLLTRIRCNRALVINSGKLTGLCTLRDLVFSWRESEP